MAPADPDSFRDEGSGGRSTRLLSLIAATVLTVVALLTNAAAQPDCKTIEDFSKAKVGEFPADWKPRKDSGKDAYRVIDRKGTRLNSSHDQISYAVFCLKKKNNYHD